MTCDGHSFRFLELGMLPFDRWGRPISEAEAQKMRPVSAKWWMGTALGANLFLATIMLTTSGSGVHGTSLALAATARVAFLWFWSAYTGGALTTLFGPAFLPLKQFGRELGLAFAAALSVHLALVGWLCWIGSAPAIGVFVFFGPVAALTFILALLSFGKLHTILGSKLWRLLRTIGMNVILYAFLKDFLQDPLHGGVRHLAEYLPFAAMAILAPLLTLAAWAKHLRESRFNVHSARP
jgi:hypothetical protein